MSFLACLFIGGIPGVMVGLLLAGLLRGNVAQDAWWMGYAEGHRDGSSEASFTVVREGPVYRRSRDGAA
jgi:hypothetical protein